MDGACKSTLFWPPPLGPGEGSKGQISLSFNYIVFILTHKRNKTYRMGFSFCRLGLASGVGLVGAGVSNI